MTAPPFPSCLAIVVRLYLRFIPDRDICRPERIRDRPIRNIAKNAGFGIFFPDGGIAPSEAMSHDSTSWLCWKAAGARIRLRPDRADFSADGEPMKELVGEFRCASGKRTNRAHFRQFVAYDRDASALGSRILRPLWNAVMGHLFRWAPTQIHPDWTLGIRSMAPFLILQNLGFGRIKLGMLPIVSRKVMLIPAANGARASNRGISKRIDTAVPIVEIAQREDSFPKNVLWECCETRNQSLYGHGPL